MIDLGEVVREDAPTPRISRTRRVLAWSARHRRWVAAGLAILLLAVIGYAQRPHLFPRPDPVAESTGPVESPQPSPMRRIEGFPEYAQGARVIAAASTPITTGSVSLTWTFTSSEVTVFDRCEYLAAEGTTLYTELSVNGRLWFGSSCGPNSGGSGSMRPDPRLWSDHGIRPGDQATLTLKVTKSRHHDQTSGEKKPVPLPQTGLLAVAIGEKVPFSAYPLPPRPSVLPELQVPVSGNAPENNDSGLHLVDETHAPTTIEVPLSWTGSFDVNLASSTPGSLRVSIAGVPVQSCDFWDYTGSSCGISWTVGQKNGFPWQGRITAKKGATVILRVTPEHVTGPWGVRITQY